MYSSARKIKKQNSVGRVALRLEVKWASLNEVTVDKRELNTQDVSGGDEHTETKMPAIS